MRLLWAGFQADLDDAHHRAAAGDGAPTIDERVNSWLPDVVERLTRPREQA